MKLVCWFATLLFVFIFHSFLCNILTIPERKKKCFPLYVLTSQNSSRFFAENSMVPSIGRYKYLENFNISWINWLIAYLTLLSENIINGRTDSYPNLRTKIYINHFISKEFHFRATLKILILGFKLWSSMRVFCGFSIVIGNFLS